MIGRLKLVAALVATLGIIGLWALVAGAQDVEGDPVINCEEVTFNLVDFPLGEHFIGLNVDDFPESVFRLFEGPDGSVTFTWTTVFGPNAGIDVTVPGTHSFYLHWIANGGGQSSVYEFDTVEEGCAEAPSTTTTEAPTTTTTVAETTTTTPETSAAQVTQPPAVSTTQPPPALPRTGSDTNEMAVYALVLLAIGGLVLLANRKVKTS